MPVFPDVDLVTGNVTAEHIERVLTPRSRAVLLVHFYGLAAEIRPIVELCERRGLILIEDCCQSILASDGSSHTGAFGTMGCFSLDREKHLSTDGGGVIVTNDGKIAEKCRRFAHDRGCEHKEGYGRIHSWLGYNYRYNSLQAAVGLAQLESFEERMTRRMSLARRLAKQLENTDGIVLPRVSAGKRACILAFPLSRRSLVLLRTCSGIGARTYTKGVAVQPGALLLGPGESHFASRIL